MGSLGGYRRQFQRIRDERAHFTKLLTDSNLAIQDAFIEKIESILELATDAKSLWDLMTPQERREFLNKVVSNPILDGPSVRFEMKKPFSTLSKMASSEDWRSFYVQEVTAG